MFYEFCFFFMIFLFFLCFAQDWRHSMFFFCVLLSLYMGVSTGNRQLIRRPRPNLMKLLQVIELFFLIILVKKILIFASIFLPKHAKNFSMFSSFFRKKNFCLSKTLILLYENSFNLYIQYNILNPHVKLHQKPWTKNFFLIFFTCSWSNGVLHLVLKKKSKKLDERKFSCMWASTPTYGVLHALVCFPPDSNRGRGEFFRPVRLVFV